MSVLKRECGILVEGPIDQAAVEKIFRLLKVGVSGTRPMQGKPYIKKNIGQFNREVEKTRKPLFTLVDLDLENCAPGFRKRLLPAPAREMIFRVAVRELESWFLADRGGLSRFLQVEQELIPANPEDLSDPKLALVNLARNSRSTDVKRKLVPHGTGAKVGRGYTTSMRLFCEHYWRPHVAANNSPSLRRAIEALKTVIG